MKPTRILPALALGLLLAVSASAQHHHTGSVKVDYDPEPGGGDPNPPEGCAGVPAKIQITGSSVNFSPNDITVDAGQKVCWTWTSTPDPHNIKGDDGSFTSGQPNTSGNFSKTFDTPGTYGFHCQVHGSPTGGMRGTVVVREAAGGGGAGEGPGKLQLAPTSVTVVENAGALTITVERVDGSDGAASVKYAVSPGTAKPGKDYLPRTGTLKWTAGDGDPKSFDLPIKNDSAIEPDEGLTVKLSKATGATLGDASAAVTIHDDDNPACSTAVSAPASLAAVGKSRHEILLTWSDADPAAAAIHVQRRHDGETFRDIAVAAGGANSFFDSALPDGATFQYRLRAEGSDGTSAYSAIAVGATDGGVGECAEGPHTRCLNDGRFAATAKWRPAEGERWRPATRTIVDQAPRSGLFSLAPAGDLQLMLNVIDGCAVNGRFWVYLAAVTDAELQVEVRDTRSGRTWVYFNPAGEMAAPLRDVEALETCP